MPDDETMALPPALREARLGGSVAPVNVEVDLVDHPVDLGGGHELVAEAGQRGIEAEAAGLEEVGDELARRLVADSDAGAVLNTSGLDS
jgi:hypothetical protein